MEVLIGMAARHRRAQCADLEESPGSKDGKQITTLKAWTCTAPIRRAKRVTSTWTHRPGARQLDVTPRAVS